MLLNYSKEELWSLYQEIPKELQRAVFSEEIGKNIREICQNHKITEEKTILSIIKSVGYVFLGLLSPDSYSQMLQKDLSLPEKKADELSADIINIIFVPLKKHLEPLYQIKMKVPKNITVTKTKNNEVKKIDKYRESVE